MSDTKDRNLDDDQAQARLPHLMRIDEVAEHLGVSVRHVRRLVQERRIPLEVGPFRHVRRRRDRQLARVVPLPAESDRH
ncbi:MAG TPA: helix-turn-helix domain-containing protein [Acidimicrobiales bacterium]|nr:helix-turn-helix domain-containing protein [Acidimicrobiales bacterium]